MLSVRWAASSVFAVAVSACGGGDGTSPPLTPPPAEDSFCSIPEELIFSGGVGRDAIPALLNPPLVAASAPEAGYLRDFDRVIGIEAGGQFIAVPHNILWWHEIVNLDDFGLPMAVSYCPLTGSSMVFDRTSVGGVDLGVSGLLYNNNLIMFNRLRDGTTESLFPQMMRGARCGPLDGEPLALLPSTEIRWDAWKELHPETLVVSGILGYLRDYRQYPYNDYEALHNPETLYPHEELNRDRPPKERVLGIPRDRGFGMAFPFSVLESRGDLTVVHDDVQDTESIVVFWSTAAQSAVAYKPNANGQELTFEVRDGKFVDVETGSEWTLSGMAVAGAYEGVALEGVPDAYVSFWFAWSTFQPNAGLLPGPRPRGS
jgi:hypothetical protein